MRRELAIGLASPLTWWVAALVAFVVGHSFVLSLDLFTAASRSVDGVGTMARGLEPLLGVVAPTLGAASFCLTLLGPILAARMIAVDRERRTLHAVLLRGASPATVLGKKWLVAVGCLLLLVAPAVLCLVAWRAIGGHIGAAETVVALTGAVLHIAVLAAWGAAAAAWTRGLAEAVAVTLALSCGSWIVDGTSEFAALSWMSPIAELSLSPHLAGMERGLVRVGDVAWLVLVIIATLVIAYAGLRVDASPRARAAMVAVALLGSIPVLTMTSDWDAGRDFSDSRRASLPAAVTVALREIDEPVVLDVWLDRDDARRTHVQRDALLRLRLAIDDLTIRFPLDADPASIPAIGEDDYGLIVVNIGDKAVSTRSTARRELSTLILETAERPVPAWNESQYPGHALVIDSGTRAWIAALVYLAIPLAFGLAGGWLRLRA